MLAIEPGTWYKGDEELRAVCVWSCVRHGQKAWDIMLELEVFVGEAATVDGFSSSAIVIGEVAALSHEIGDHTMEV